MSTPEELDRALRNRINKLVKQFTEKQKDVALSDVFENKYVIHAMEAPKVILPSYDLKEIIANFPFVESLCVAVCPECDCVGDRSDLLKLLERKAITLILYGNYAHYPTEFVNDILLFPHVSFHEFRFFRFASLMSRAKTGTCHHCVEVRRKELFKICKTKYHDLLKLCFWYLDPFIDGDLQFLDMMDNALRNDDQETIFQLCRLAAMIRDLRSAQAYDARLLLTRESVNLISSDKRLAETAKVSLDTKLVADLLAQDIGITVPDDKADVNAFLDIYEPYRQQIIRIVDSIVEESTTDDKISVYKLSSLLSDLNGQISEISKRPGYLLYRASVGFAKSNKALIGGLLLAGALGLMGKYLGCEIAAGSVIGAHFWGKKPDVKVPSEAKKLASEVNKLLWDPVHKILAKYLDVDVRAVQICEMKKNLKEST